MATETKKETKVIVDNIHKKIATLRASKELKGIKKTGLNKHIGSSYYELADFLPLCNDLELKLGLTSDFNLKEDVANLIVTNIDNPEESKVFEITVAEANLAKALEIQKKGAQITYLKRYLYLNYLNLTDGDRVEGSNEDDIEDGVPEVLIKELTELLKVNADRKTAMLGHYGVKKIEELNKTQVVGAIKILKQ